MNSRLLIRIGWLLFAVGWVPFTGIFIGLIGFPEGSYAWDELPTITRFSLIATGIIFGFSFITIFSGQILGYLTNRRVVELDHAADTVELEVSDPSTANKENPRVQ